MRCVARFDRPADAQKFWKVASTEEGMLLFAGFGVVPGIKSIEELQDGYKRITNTDGTSHRERTVLQTQASLELEMDGFAGLGARLFSSFRERWQIEGGNVITREFVIRSRDALWAKAFVKAVVRPCMRAAMRANMRAIAHRTAVSVEISDR